MKTDKIILAAGCFWGDRRFAYETKLRFFYSFTPGKSCFLEDLFSWVLHIISLNVPLSSTTIGMNPISLCEPLSALFPEIVGDDNED